MPRNYKDPCSAAYYGDVRALDNLLKPKEADEEVPIPERVRRREAKLNEAGLLTSYSGPVRKVEYGFGFCVDEAEPHSNKFAYRFKPSKQSSDTAAPLHWAVLGGEAVAVLWLLRNGARTDAVATRFAATPGDVAARNGPAARGARAVHGVLQSSEAAVLQEVERMKTAVDDGFAALQRDVPAVASREAVEVRPLQLQWCGTTAAEPDAGRKRERPFGDPPRLFLASGEGSKEEGAPPGAEQTAARLQQLYAKATARHGLLGEWAANLGIPLGRAALLLRRVAAAARADGAAPADLPDAALCAAYLYSCEASDVRDLLKTVVPKPPKPARPPRDPDDPDAPPEEEAAEPEPEAEAGGDGDEALNDGSEGIPANEVPDELPDLRREVVTALRGTDDEAPKLQEKWAITIAALLAAAARPLAAPVTVHRAFKEPPEEWVAAVKALKEGDTAVWGALTGWSAAEPDEPPGEGVGLVVVVEGVGSGLDFAGPLSRYASEREVCLPPYSLLTVTGSEAVGGAAPAEPAADGGDGGDGDAPAAGPAGVKLTLRCGGALFGDEAAAQLAAWLEQVRGDMAAPSDAAARVHEWQGAHVAQLVKAKEARVFQRAAVEGEEDAARGATEAEQDAGWGDVRTALDAQYEAIAHLMPVPGGGGDAEGAEGDGEAAEGDE